MLRIKAHFAKKVAAAGSYGSTCFGADVEIEVADGDTRNVEERLRTLWKTLRDSVEKEIATTEAKATSPAPSPAPNGPTPPRQVETNDRETAKAAPARTVDPHARAAGDDSERLSQKQRGFALALGARMGIRLPQLHERARSMFGRPLFELTRKEASQFIDALRSREDEGEAA
jgi:hypothetical protein